MAELTVRGGGIQTKSLVCTQFLVLSSGNNVVSLYNFVEMRIEEVWRGFFSPAPCVLFFSALLDPSSGPAEPASIIRELHLVLAKREDTRTRSRRVRFAARTLWG